MNFLLLLSVAVLDKLDPEPHRQRLQPTQFSKFSAETQSGVAGGARILAMGQLVLQDSLRQAGR